MTPPPKKAKKSSGRRSRDKGARGEREAAAFLSAWFPGAERGVSQTRGGIDGPDVEGVYGLWVEVKRLAAPQAEKWMAQAENDLAEAATKFPRLNTVPIVVFRGDRGRYRVVIDAEWFFNEYVAARPWLKNGEEK